MFYTEIDNIFNLLLCFQAFGIHEALENENQTRREYSNGSDILYSLEDLRLGAKGDLKTLSQGRRFELMLGGEGDSCFSYRAVLLDAREDSGPFMYNCGVFIVPKVCLCLPIWFPCTSRREQFCTLRTLKKIIEFELRLTINRILPPFLFC